MWKLGHQIHINAPLQETQVLWNSEEGEHSDVIVWSGAGAEIWCPLASVHGDYPIRALGVCDNRLLLRLTLKQISLFHIKSACLLIHRFCTKEHFNNFFSVCCFPVGLVSANSHSFKGRCLGGSSQEHVLKVEVPSWGLKLFFSSRRISGFWVSSL